MFFHNLLTQFNSYCHCSSYTGFVVQIITCKVKILFSFVILKFLVEFMIKFIKNLLFTLNFTAGFNQTLWPIMNSKTFLVKFKLIFDFLRYQFPYFFRNLLLNLIMTKLNVFSTRCLEFFCIFFCKFLTHLNDSNISLIVWIFLLMEADKS